MTLTLRRVIGFGIDSLLVGIPLSVIALVFWVLRILLMWIPIFNIFSALFSIAWASFSVFFLYDFLSMLLFNTTVGKMAMRIKVVMHDGSQLTLKQKVLRSLLRALQFSFIGFGLVMINLGVVVLRGENWSLHDLIVGTQVWRK